MIQSIARYSRRDIKGIDSFLRFRDVRRFAKDINISALNIATSESNLLKSAVIRCCLMGSDGPQVLLRQSYSL